ncbi:hypothetical protein GCM10017602_10710 [Herbiconiux flava]|nr:hypothetical protein GCM10017602_10710 [Herbiconiux flava]
MWRGLQLDAVDYEIVRLSASAGRPDAVAFADAHHVTSPSWRLVSGYLSFEVQPEDGSPRAGDQLVVRSHGHLVARVRRIAEGGRTAEGAGVRIEFEHDPITGPDGVRSEGGIAIVPDEGSRVVVEGRVAELRGGPQWGAALVHGPAEIKLDNRIRLLRSLERVGGRHG